MPKHSEVNSKPLHLHADTDFSSNYFNLLHDIMHKGDDIFNERTSALTKALTGQMIEMDCSGGVLRSNGLRADSPRIAAAELAWILSAKRDTEWLQQHTDMWEQFKDDGIVQSAYGYRWQEAFGRNQLKLLVKSLRKDPSDRQAKVSAWDPAQDGLGNIYSKNVPCPTDFTCNIVDNKLNLQVMIRSSDVAIGLIYDSLMYGLLLNTITHSLNQEPDGLNVRSGKLTMFLSHAHIYEQHFETALDMLETTPIPIAFEVPKFTIEDIKADKDGYVDAVKEATKSRLKAPFKRRINVAA